MCALYYLPNHQLVIGTDPLDSFEELTELLGYVKVTPRCALWSSFLFYVRRVDTLGMAQVCACVFFSIFVLAVVRLAFPASIVNDRHYYTQNAPTPLISLVDCTPILSGGYNRNLL